MHCHFTFFSIFFLHCHSHLTVSFSLSARGFPFFGFSYLLHFPCLVSFGHQLLYFLTQLQSSLSIKSSKTCSKFVISVSILLAFSSFLILFPQLPSKIVIAVTYCSLVHFKKHILLFIKIFSHLLPFCPLWYSTSLGANKYIDSQNLPTKQFILLFILYHWLPEKCYTSSQSHPYQQNAWPTFS